MVKDDQDRLLKLFIFPTMLINALIMTVIPEYRSAGMIYLILGGLTWLIYITPRFQDVLIGVKQLTVTTGIFQGILFGAGFIALAKYAPSFSIAIPSLSLSIAENIRAFITIFIAPATEEPLMRGGILNSTQGLYNLSFWQANILQGVLFSFLHLLSYGVFLGGLQKWAEVFGQFQAIISLFVTAFIFALIAGVLVNKFKNLWVVMIGHGLVNGFLFFAPFIIVA